MGLFTKLFGTYSERQIKRIRKIAGRVEALAPKYSAMSNEELRQTTDALRARLSAGETLDSILPDAFALVREADDRVLGKRPFYVQILGGILLHQGRIAEMKTGEGKTLVATLPAYLNALTGKGVHIVTVNDYLARRDSEEMGRVYAFLGLTTGLVVHGQYPDEKKVAYAADITYGTNNEFGFDYLRDNLVTYKEQMVQRGHAFAIVDEVDSILIDEARTPLIISGEGEESTDLYDKAEKFARTLKKCVVKELDEKADQDTLDGDYVVDEKARNAILSASGIAKAEKFFHIENLSDPENATLYHHINQAIRAHGVMQRDIDYVVKDNEVIIVDSFTGRLMPGRRYNEGLHQAIEAKEYVDVQKESKPLATITFQNYFRMYRKLSGMTGTALTEDAEFREIYAIDVVEVPTNRPMIRIDHNDAIYIDKNRKSKAIINQILACHTKGQPVLIGTVSIEQSEALSRLLDKNGIKHTVLNAKHHEKEAEIVAQAGKLGAVTISTNMAGRGTDIMLGGNPEYLARTAMRREDFSDELIAAAVATSPTEDEEILAARERYRTLYEKYKEEIRPEADKVREAGGLFILGTERHESRRIDNQLRGRSGRQGDPGESRFFLSMEDDLMRLFSRSELVQSIIRRWNASEDADTPIAMTLISGAIERAQRSIEGQNFNRRKHVLSYDDVMNQQRQLIYRQRGEVLDGADLSKTLTEMIETTVAEAVASTLPGDNREAWDLDELRNRFIGLLTTNDSFRYGKNEAPDAETIREELTKRALDLYRQKEELLGAEVLREAERAILLRNVDTLWMEHLDDMEDLKGSVGLNAYAQRNPLNEFRIIGNEVFADMIDEIRIQTVRKVLSLQIREEPVVRREVARQLTEGFAGGKMPEKKASAAPIKSQKVGRNDPCPCGSGEKYKKCCGAPSGAKAD
ncbi:MAG: preprotein translocase subunit SecA [Clostridia bacterium]|nr:preprotein translocase subunit SecA [Clostridia bacterium]